LWPARWFPREAERPCWPSQIFWAPQTPGPNKTFLFEQTAHLSREKAHQIGLRACRVPQGRNTLAQSGNCGKRSARAESPGDGAAQAFRSPKRACAACARKSRRMCTYEKRGRGCRRERHGHQELRSGLTGAPLGRAKVYLPTAEEGGCRAEDPGATLEPRRRIRGLAGANECGPDRDRMRR